jgi:WD40 repeat protein
MVILVGTVALGCLTALALLWYWKPGFFTTDSARKRDLPVTPTQGQDNLDLFLPNLGTITDVALSPNAEYIAIATHTWKKGQEPIAAAGIWSRHTRRQIAWLPVDGEVQALAFSPQGELLAVAAWASAIQLWETRTWKLRTSVGEEYKESFRVGSFSFSNDGTSLAASYSPDEMGSKKPVRIWNVATRTPTLIGDAPFSPNRLSLSSDNRFLAAGDFRSNLTIWEVASRKQHWALEAHSDPISHRTGIQGVAFLPDSRTLVSAGTDGLIQMRDVVLRRQKHSFAAKVGEVRAFALSPTGTLVAVAGRPPGSTVPIMRVFQLPDGKELNAHGTLPTNVSCLCFSQNDEWLGVGTCATDPYGTEGVHFHLVSVSKPTRGGSKE